MKIHLVETAGFADRLVKAHTRAGAERFVRDSIKPTVTARVPSQDELLAAVQHTPVEDATQPAGAGATE